MERSVNMKQKKNYYPKSQVKYPRNIAQAEIFNQHDLTPEQKNSILLQNKIERLTNESFNLNGAYPYLIDLVNYLCTHHRDIIERQNNVSETHYRVRIPKETFNEIILEEYKDQKDWQSVLKDEKGAAWFPFPVRFQAKLIDFIKRHKDDNEFKKYGTFGHASNYRKLYLYLNLHDNSKSDEINYNAIDLTLKTLPSNTQKTPAGEYFLRNWFTSHQFFQKALRLFYCMGKEGLLDGVKLIPTSVWYDKPIKELKVKINRGKTQLQAFTNKVTAIFTETSVDNKL